VGEWIGWHFLRSDRRLGYGDGRLVVVGETLKLPGGVKPVLCESGFHASRKATGALYYAPGDIVCRVRLSGVIVEGDDKAVASERTVLALADATATLHEFACWSAEQVLHLAGDAEPVCRQAIEIKRRWLRGEATSEELDAARVAVRVAARAASGDVVRVAARAAVRAAGDDTAWDVAGDAAAAAARAAARDAQEAKLSEMLNDLLAS
jgi:hypothetical protein